MNVMFLHFFLFTCVACLCAITGRNLDFIGAKAGCMSEIK